mmetsp:Transcript_10530/g.64621  ORF Transcript_10530/g.64621 Transcript_10530/m.64621 type:complete len:89 (-) Transcript_10530:608-874(-)
MHLLCLQPFFEMHVDKEYPKVANTKGYDGSRRDLGHGYGRPSPLTLHLGLVRNAWRCAIQRFGRLIVHANLVHLFIVVWMISSLRCTW